MLKSGTALCCLLSLVACDPVSLTLLGVGAGVGAAHQLGGLTYKTFTEPLPRVKSAALAALKRMAIKVESTEKTSTGQRIKATAADRSIEIELDALTANTTRMRAVARKDGGIIVDSATAVEIIVQTEKALAST